MLIAYNSDSIKLVLGTSCFIYASNTFKTLPCSTIDFLHKYSLKLLVY